MKDSKSCEEEDDELNRIPEEIIETYNFISDFQEHLFTNSANTLFDATFNSFISAYESILSQFETVFSIQDQANDKVFPFCRRLAIKFVLQLISSVLYRSPANYGWAFKTLSFFKDEILQLFHSNELIDLFYGNKLMLLELLKLGFISIEDVMSTPFSISKHPQLLLFNSWKPFNYKSESQPNFNLTLKANIRKSTTLFSTSNYSPQSQAFSKSLFSGLRPNKPLSKISTETTTISNQEKFDFFQTEICSLLWPEIDQFDHNFALILPNLFSHVEQFKQSDSNRLDSTFYEYRKKLINHHLIPQLIYENQVDELKFQLKNKKMSLPYSLFEYYSIVNDRNHPLTPIEFAAFFHSLDVFRFLLLDVTDETVSSLPPLHFSQKERILQTEKALSNFEKKLKNSDQKIGLLQMNYEQVVRYQNQFQQKLQTEQLLLEKQQKESILNTLPKRLPLFAIASGNAAIIHILELYGIDFSNLNDLQLLDASIVFHQNSVFSYLLDNYHLIPTVDTFIACVKSSNFVCFDLLLNRYYSIFMNSINEKGKEGMTVFQVACALGKFEFVWLLTLLNDSIEEHGQFQRMNINLRNSTGQSSLHLACASGSIEIVQYLISHYDSLPLNSSNIHVNRIQSVKILSKSMGFNDIQSTACQLNLNVKDFKGKSIAQTAYENGFIQIVKIIVCNDRFDINSKDDSGVTLIHLATMNNDLEMIKFIVNASQHQVNINAEKKSDKRTPLLIAASNGNYEIVKYLMSLPNIDSKHRDITGQMSHHLACSSLHTSNQTDIEKYQEKYSNYFLKKQISQTGQSSNLNVLRFLIEHEHFPVNEKDSSGKTPLHHSLIVGNFDLVKFLITVPGIDIDCKDKDGRTSLHLAFANDNLQLAKFLVENTTANIHAKDNDGRTSLHLSAQNGLYNNVFYLLSLMETKKAKVYTEFNSDDEDEDDENDINLTDNFGRTCLHLAMESGNTKLIQYLLSKNGINLNARDKGGRTILHYAASFNYIFVIQFLIDQGSFPQNQRNQSIYTFSSPYSSSKCKFDIMNINAKANHDWTALHFAAAGGFVEMCRLLINARYVNANARDTTGMTPLHLAVQHEKINTVKFLVDHKDVYVNTQDKEGRTPLHWACAQGQIEAIKYLLQCKEIDVTRKDRNSQTAFKHLTAENQKLLAPLFKLR